MDNSCRIPKDKSKQIAFWNEVESDIKAANLIRIVWEVVFQKVGRVDRFDLLRIHDQTLRQEFIKGFRKPFRKPFLRDAELDGQALSGRPECAEERLRRMREDEKKDQLRPQREFVEFLVVPNPRVNLAVAGHKSSLDAVARSMPLLEVSYFWDLHNWQLFEEFTQIENS